jgi:electron transport complex protein RnfC
MDGVLLMMQALRAAKVIIGIEKNKVEAYNALVEYVKSNGINQVRVVALKVKYPQGSDRQMIYALTGIKLSKQARSSSIGLAITNVHTAFAVYQAVRLGIPSHSRVITVSGKGIKNPKNLLVATGTSFQDVIDYCGGYSEEFPPVKIIAGGPMTGIGVLSTDFPVTKTTSGITLLSAIEETDLDQSSPCINCGKCGRVCPMKLMPMFIDAHTLAGNFAEGKNYGAEHCIECGCCAYICPAKRNLVQSIRLCKANLKKEGKR